MEAESLRVRLLPLIILAVLSSAVFVAAYNGLAVDVKLSEDEYEKEYEEEEEEREEESELAEALGSVAWNLGVPLVLGFVAYKHVYIWLAKRRIKPFISLSLNLKIHVAASLLLGTAALIHGAMLIEYAGPVEYAAGLLVALVTVSGAILYFTRGRHNRYVRLVHAQRLLALLTLAAVALHVALMD